MRGVKTLCHMPCPAFFQAPMDGCVIFKVTDDCTAVCCNFSVDNVEDDLFLTDIILHEGDNSKVELKERISTNKKRSWLGFHPNKSNIALASALTVAGAVAVQSALGSSRNFKR